ncbi:Ig-like domain-containing protein [Pseudomonas amygdali pv. lachrymans]|nr:Ig-like domain-containing protein [Pseudomonas amygdali pv. lachrymans]
MTLTSVTYPSQLTVTAMAGTVEASINMEFTSDVGSGGALPDNAILMDQTATAWAIPADGVTTTTLTVVLTDAYGTPVAAGLVVPWSTNAGTLSSASTLTDSTGRASVTLTAPTSATAVVVTSNGKWPFRITTW